MEKTPTKTGVKAKGASSGATPVSRPKPVKPKTPDWHEKIKVRNLTSRKLTTQSGSLAPNSEGKMSRLDADRMRNYVEIVDG